MKRKIIMFGIVIIILSIFLGLLYVKRIYVPSNNVKQALRHNDITSTSYILCKEARVTGFDWMLIQNEDNENMQEFCNIIGPNPFEDLDLSYEFSMAQNTFIFYIEERREYYSEELKQDCIEYIVSGWDILYPVKHAALSGTFEPNTCIIDSDISK